MVKQAGQAVADKADAAALTSGLGRKINTETYTAAITSINTSLADKADKAAVDALQAAVDAATESRPIPDSLPRPRLGWSAGVRRAGRHHFFAVIH